MDKVETNFSHNININDRKNISITGIKKIESFDNEEFLLESVMGYIIVKGEGLEIIKLDTMQGNVSIKGKINQLAYIENTKKKEKGEGIITKLFK
jgi:sporulation protein YabP